MATIDQRDNIVLSCYSLRIMYNIPQWISPTRIYKRLFVTAVAVVVVVVRDSGCVSSGAKDW